MDRARACAVELDPSLAMAEISAQHELFFFFSPLSVFPSQFRRAREFHCAFFPPRSGSSGLLFRSHTIATSQALFQNITPSPVNRMMFGLFFPPFWLECVIWVAAHSPAISLTDGLARYRAIVRGGGSRDSASLRVPVNAVAQKSAFIHCLSFFFFF